MLAALITLVCLIAAGAVWLVRRTQQIAVVEAKVADAKKVEAAEVAKADATLVEERAKDPIDVVNGRFGRRP